MRDSVAVDAFCRVTPLKESIDRFGAVVDIGLKPVVETVTSGHDDHRAGGCLFTQAAYGEHVGLVGRPGGIFIAQVQVDTTAEWCVKL